MEKMRPNYKKRYPYRKLDGTVSETRNVTNLYNKEHIATNPIYRNNYDEIKWDDDAYEIDVGRLSERKEKDNKDD